MRIEIAHHEADADYIRHARIETLKSVDVDPHPSLVEPLAVATYLIAYDGETGQPIGMAEVAMLSKVYHTFDDAPYASLCDLNTYCPLGQMASMRTVYVEPEHRHRPIFWALTFGAAKMLHEDGARFATATTRGSDQYLNRLYEKCGGERIGTVCMGQKESSALFVFDLEKTLRHRAMRRLLRYVTFDYKNEPETAH